MLYVQFKFVWAPMSMFQRELTAMIFGMEYKEAHASPCLHPNYIDQIGAADRFAELRFFAKDDKAKWPDLVDGATYIA